MTVITQCGHCGKIYRHIPRKFIGRKANCKACGKKFIVRPIEKAADPKAAAATVSYGNIPDRNGQDVKAEQTDEAAQPDKGQNLKDTKKIAVKAAAATVPYEDIPDRNDQDETAGKTDDATQPDEARNLKKAKETAVKAAAATVLYEPAQTPSAGTATKPCDDRPDMQAESEAGQKTSHHAVIKKDKTGTVAGNTVFHEWTIGETILGLYQVRDIFESGAMGAVYRMRHTQWDIDLVVKKPLPEILRQPGGSENFEREAETWVDLGLHPNIVTCYYVRRIQGIPHIFAEFIDAGDLSQWIEDGRLYEGGHQKSLERILDIAIQFARGLSHAHSKGIIHQDVKPGNVMITANGTARITDFGLSAASSQWQGNAPAPEAPGATIVVDGKGLTLEYASPEQFARKPLTRRSDLWSWALSVLEMFTGEILWQAGPVAAMALDGYLRTATGDEVMPPMPKVLADFLMRCFENDSQKRPKSMDEAEKCLTAVYSARFGKAYHRIKPESGGETAGTLNNRALSLIDLNRKEDALPLWEKALKLEPHHPESTYNFGLVRWRSGQIDDLDLVNEMQEVLSSHENRWTGAYLMGLIHLERGDCDAALSILAKIDRNDTRRREVRDVISTAQKLKPHSLKLLGDLTASIPGFLHSASCADADSLIVAFASGTVKKMLQIGIADGREIQSYECGNEKITAVCTSRDGKLLLTGGTAGALRLYEKADGKLLQQINGHEGPVMAVGLARNGRIAITGAGYQNSRNSEIISVWDLQQGTKIREFGGNSGFVRSLTTLSDQRHVVVFSNTNTEIRDWTTGEISAVCPNCQGAACGCLSRDEKIVIAGHSGGSGKGAFNTWEWETQASGDRFDHGKKTINVDFFPENRYIFAAHEEGLVRIWDLEKKRCLMTIQAHDRAVLKTMISHCENYGISVGALSGVWKSVKVWHLGKRNIFSAPLSISRIAVYEETENARTKFRNHMDAAADACEKGALRLAVRHIRKARTIQGYNRNEKAIKLWTQLYRSVPRSELAGAWEVQSLLNEGHKHTAFQIVHDGSLAVVRGKKPDAGFKLVEPQTSLERTCFQTQYAGFRALCLSNDGKYVLSGDNLNRVKLWHTGTGRSIRMFEGHAKPVSAVCLSRDARYALSGGKDRTVRLWDTDSGRCLHLFEAGNQRAGAAEVLAVEMAASGKFFMTAQYMDYFKLWDMETLELSKIWADIPPPTHFPAPDIISLDFTGKRALVCTDYENNAVKMVEVATGKVIKTFEGHSGIVQTAVFSFDGRHALSGGNDTTVRLWDIDSAKCIRIFEGHLTPVRKVALTRDSRIMFSEDETGVMKLWLLDWELDEQIQKTWDDAAIPFISAFLERQRPYAGSIPTGRKPQKAEIRNGLTRTGIPLWNDSEFDEFMIELGEAGFGFIPPEIVKLKLNESKAEATIRRIRRINAELLPFFESLADKNLQCSDALNAACQILEKIIELRFSFDNASENQTVLNELCNRVIRIPDIFSSKS